MNIRAGADGHGRRVGQALPRLVPHAAVCPHHWGCSLHDGSAVVLQNHGPEVNQGVFEEGKEVRKLFASAAVVSMVGVLWWVRREQE